MEFVAYMAMVLVTLLFIVTFNLQAFEIPTSSMMNTLLIGDHLFVDRISAAPKAEWVGPLMPYHDLQRGDIVVFLSVTQPGQHIVKRVIGVSGDRIRLQNGIVYRNGEKVDEPYVIHSRGDYSPYRDNFPAVTPELGTVAPEWHATMTSFMQTDEI